MREHTESSGVLCADSVTVHGWPLLERFIAARLPPALFRRLYAGIVISAGDYRESHGVFGWRVLVCFHSNPSGNIFVVLVTMIRGAIGRRLHPGAPLLLLPVLAVVTACGTVAVEHEAHLTLNDPTRRLGPPPWHMSVDSPSWMKDGGSNGRGVVHGFSAPGSPFHGIFSHVRGVVGLTARSEKEEIGFAIPALADGWWRAEVIVAADGTSRGEARFCRWGSSQPDPNGQVLAVRGKAKPNPNGNGWQFDLTIDIPAAPTAEEMDAAADRRVARLPLQGTCSFVMDGQPTMELPSGAQVAVVTTSGDARRAAAVRDRMEAILRLRGCAVVDRTRLDVALRDELAPDARSAAAMDRLAKSGATLVLVVDPAGENSVRIVDVATREVLGNWSLRD